jgi:hypothetical protein
MASKSKAENAAALVAANIPRKGFSRAEFCGRWGMSEGFYRELQKRGLGPRETRILDRVIITDEDELDWQRERQAQAEETVR